MQRVFELGNLTLLPFWLSRTLRTGIPDKIRAIAGWVAQGSGPLVALTFGSLGLLAASLALQLIDPREVLGVSTWVKPAKFAISVALNAATLAVLLRWLQPLTRGMRRAVPVMSAMLALELIIIGVQAARGVPSHFNNATTIDTILFAVMGASITVFWVGLIYLGWRAFRQRFASPALGWGIRLGFIAVVLGSGLGFIMPRPTPAQLESLQAGHPTPTIGAHAVGVEDGGPGLPVTGWSTEGGDLRVPHFVGMHGLQLLPLLGWLAGRRARRGAARITAAAGAGYLGLTGVLLLQALRGQPLPAPDGWTWLTLVAVVVLSLVLAVTGRRRKSGGVARSNPHPVVT
jgi:hypothetical protein